jgi:hypothetical protein
MQHRYPHIPQDNDIEQATSAAATSSASARSSTPSTLHAEGGDLPNAKSPRHFAIVMVFLLV